MRELKVRGREKRRNVVVETCKLLTKRWTFSRHSIKRGWFYWSMENKWKYIQLFFRSAFFLFLFVFVLVFNERKFLCGGFKLSILSMCKPAHTNCIYIYLKYVCLFISLLVLLELCVHTPQWIIIIINKKIYFSYKNETKGMMLSKSSFFFCSTTAFFARTLLFPFLSKQNSACVRC